MKTTLLNSSRRQLASLSAASLAAAAVGFLIHLGSQSWIRNWVSEQMEGRQVTPSWDVRYVAFATSIEVGVGVAVLYALVRNSLPFKSAILRGLVFGILLLAVMGRLIRQPLMNLVVGNPPLVVLVQDGVSWVLWLAVSIVTAITFEHLSRAHAA